MRIATVLLSLLSLLWLSACSSTPAEPAANLSQAEAAVIVPEIIDASQQIAPMAPPALPPEMMPANDRPDLYVWRPGYWLWTGQDYRYEAGSLISRPFPTAVWRAEQWVQRAYGWSMMPGFWE